MGLPQAWSLTAEECFYFSLPVLLVLWRRYGYRGRSVCGRSIGYRAGAHGSMPGARGAARLFWLVSPPVQLYFFGRVLEFTMGVGLARWWGGRPTASVAGWPWRTTLSLALDAGGRRSTGLARFAVRLVRRQPEAGDHHAQRRLLSGLHDAAAGRACSRSKPGCGRPWAPGCWTRWASARIRFYLIQIGLLSIWWRNEFGWRQHVGWQLLVTMVFSELLYRLVEEPARRWILARTLPRGEWS